MEHLVITENAPDILLGAWNIFPDKIDETQADIARVFAEVEEAGFHAVGMSFGEYSDEADAVFAELEKRTIKLIAHSPAIVTGKEIGEVLPILEKLCDSDFFMGFILKDEPSAGDFVPLAEAKAVCDAVLPAGRFTICNLFPNYASHQQLGVGPTPGLDDLYQIDAGIDTPAYDRYLAQYMEIFRPSILSYDHYQITDSLRTCAPGCEKYIYRYIANLSSIRKAAFGAGIPFYNVIQAWSYNDIMLYPNIHEYLWTMNTSIALGATGMIAFSFRNVFPEGEGPEKWKDCPITLSGDRTASYYVLKKCNTEILAYSKAFMQFRNVGVWAYNCPDYMMKALDGSFIVNAFLPVDSLSGDSSALIGCMEKDGQKGVYVTNADFREEADLVLHLDSARTYEIWDKEGRHESESADNIHICLGKGEAMFIAF